jgi:hypothetical protein
MARSARLKHDDPTTFEGDVVHINVPGLDVNQANLQSVDLAKVSIGPITVGDLVLSNTDVSMSVKDMLLQDVTVWMNIHFTFQWNVHIGLPDGIPDFDVGATWDLGTLHIPPFGLPPIPLGDIVVPGLTNINLHIPTVTAQNMSVNASPLALHLDAPTADQIHATNATLPVGGFSIAGLSLNSVQGTAISVPDAHLDSATINHLHGTPIKISTFALDTLKLPTAQVDHISSTAPLEIPAQLPEYPIGFGTPHKSLLSIILYVKPFAHMHVGHLEITDAAASATVGSIALNNVTLPYDVLNLTLSQVGIKTIDVPAFNVS